MKYEIGDRVIFTAGGIDDQKHGVIIDYQSGRAANYPSNTRICCYFVDFDDKVVKACHFTEIKPEKDIAIAVRRGPWDELVKIRRCLCPDGIRRIATITGQPTTYFSQPAKVQVKGKTVAGYVTDAKDNMNDYEFRPYVDCKNHAVFE